MTDFQKLKTLNNTLIKLRQDVLKGAFIWSLGFLEGRSIKECTRIIYDIITKSSQQNIDGLLLLIDFEKAFDSIEFLGFYNQHN